MNKKEKCLEYYLDSRIYDREAVEKSIEQAKQEFPKKEVDININLNEWGVYVITLYFRNKNKVLENESRKYGQYKSTGTYRPY